MKYHIEKQAEEVVISFEDLGGSTQAVIDAIGRCRQSAWACTSGECMKIGRMEVGDERGTLCVRLKPRPDQELNVASLGECLKYQLPRTMED